MSEKNLNENKSNLLLLTDIFKPISINQKFIIFLSSLFLLSSLIFSLSLSNIYKSDSLILIIAENESSVPDSLGQFSGLASIAGINLNELNGANKNSKDYIFAKLNSKDFIIDFIKKRNLLVEIMAADGWDRDEDKLKIDKSIYNFSKSEWVRRVSYPRKKVPSFHEAYENFLEKNFSVFINENTGFLILNMKSYSPKTSMNWLRWLIDDFNEIIKQEDVDEARKSINFLTKQIGLNPDIATKDLLSVLIKKEIQKLALADSRDQYILKTIDEPYIPEEKLSPQSGVIVFLGLILGLISSVFFSFYTFQRNLRIVISFSLKPIKLTKI